MCINQRDLREYQVIMAKMSRLAPLSNQDKQFLYEHNLKQKYDAYVVVLSVVEQLNRSNVSS
jgi:indole-3-glycerol phosphate synthase